MNEAQSSGATQTATAPRVITIVATRGEKKKIQFSGNTWKELKSLLESGGKDVNGNSFTRYDLNNMKSVESVTRHTLEHDLAVLPDGDFNLFLMPYKSKSGGEAREKVKELAKTDKAGVKSHFGNWTTMKEEELAAKLPSYKASTSDSTSKSGKKEKPAKETKTSGSTAKAAPKKATSEEKGVKAKASETKPDAKAKVKEPKSLGGDVNAKLVIEAAQSLSVEDQRIIIEALQKSAYPEPEKSLDDEYEEMRRGFKDVK